MTIEILPSFKRALKQLAKKYPSVPDDYSRLLENLQADPLQGEPLGKNCYKIRFDISSKKTGKRNNSRVITCVKIVNDTIYLLDIYDKADRSTVNDKELEYLIKQIED